MQFSRRNAIPDSLVTAFQNTHYIVLATDKPFALRIGQYSAELTYLFSHYGADCAAILTAYNPWAQTVSEQANRRAQHLLQHEIDALGFMRIDGENRAGDKDGPSEPTVIALDIPRERSRQLAQQFGQLAFVYIDGPCTPELVWTYSK